MVPRLSLAAWLILLTQPVSQAATVTWDDGETDIPGLHGDGISWHDRLNWNDDMVPLDIDDVVLTTESVRVVNGTTAFAKTLESGSTDLEINGSLDVVEQLINNATITIVSPTDVPNTGATLRVGQGSMLDGDGEILLRQSEGVGIVPAILGSTGQQPTTNGADHTIRGEGLLTANMINNGLIIAEDLDGNAGSRLRITDSIENHGVISTSPTATIQASVAITQGPTGRIVADGSPFLIDTSSVTGGTLETVNGGVFRSSGNSLDLDGVRLDGQLNLVPTGSLTGTAHVLGGGLVNAGEVLINESNTGQAGLTFFESATISGSGQVVMNREDFGARFQTIPGVVGTIGPGQTVRGVGRFEGDFVNDGLIIAEPRNGTTLRVLFGSMANNNTLRADAGAVLLLRTLTITQDDSTGVILANEGTVQLDNGVTIVGGRLEAAGAGGVTLLSAARLTDVVNNAPINIPSGNRPLLVSGASLENNGVITVGDRVIVENDLAFEGSGVIELPTVGNSRIVVNNGFVATQKPGHTVRGAGAINGPGRFVNDGVVEGPSDTVLIEINGALSGGGLLKNVRIDGVHSPGNGVGITPIEGVYRIGNFGGTLAIEIGGLAPGTGYDQLTSSDATNQVVIGASATTLSVSLVGGYVPDIGDTFTLIDTAGTISGDFPIELLPKAPNYALAWQLSYGAQQLTLELIGKQLLPGDYNGDGVVDAADYTVWRDTDGTTGLPSYSGADGNGDGQINDSDYFVWRDHYGNNASNLSARQQLVPEPGSTSLMLVVLTLSFLARSHRSHDSLK